MSRHSVIESELWFGVDYYEYASRMGEYEMSEEISQSPHAGEIERRDLNDYNAKPVTVSNDTPAGRAVNRILDKCDIKGMQPDEVRDIIEEEYLPIIVATDVQLNEGAKAMDSASNEIDLLRFQLEQARIIIEAADKLEQAGQKDREAVVMMLRSSHIHGSNTTVMDDKLVNKVATISVHLNDTLQAYRAAKGS